MTAEKRRPGRPKKDRSKEVSLASCEHPREIPASYFTTFEAQLFWRSIVVSNVQRHWESSDWAAAFILAKEIDDYNMPGSRKSAGRLDVQATIMDKLGLTIGSRKMNDIDVEPEAAHSQQHLDILEEYRNTLGVTDGKS